MKICNSAHKQAHMKKKKQQQKKNKKQQHQLTTIMEQKCNNQCRPIETQTEYKFHCKKPTTSQKEILKTEHYSRHGAFYELILLILFYVS